MREAVPDFDRLPWRTEHDLRFSDVDRQGHVSNGIFDRLMETSRVMLLDRTVAAAGKVDSFVLGRVEIDFLAEMHWPGRVTAAAGVERLGAASVTFRQALFVDGRIAAACRSVIVCIDRQSRKSKPMSDALRTGLGAWMMR